MADIQLLIDVQDQSVVKAVDRVNRLEREYKKLDRAFNTGKITAQQYAKGVKQVDMQMDALRASTGKLSGSTNRFVKDMQRSAVAMNQFGVLADRNTRNFKRFGAVGLQQVGYQVGDFAVQVQGGTNAAVAFGQQGSQLLGIFGPLGAILGAVLAVTTAMVAPMLDSAEAGGKMSEEFSKLGDQLKTIEPLLDGIRSGLKAVTNVGIDFANLLLNNLDRVIVYAGTAAALFAGKFVAGIVAARVATVSLAGAFVVLRGALIRTGIGALIVAAGEIIYQFTRLVKGAGNFGNAMLLLKDVALGVWNKIKAGGELLAANIGLIWDGIAHNFEVMLFNLMTQWGRFVDSISSTKMGQIIGLEGGVENRMADIGSRMVDAGTDRFIRLSDKAAEARAALEGPIEGVDALREAMRRADEEGQRIDIRDWLGGLGATTEDEEGSGSGSNAVDEAAKKLEELQNKVQSVADTIKDSMSDAFMSIVDGTKSAKDAFREMARAVIKQLYDVLVVQQLVGSFNATTGQGSGLVGAIMGAFTGQANGGAWNNGVQMFANGGVVNGPTGFRHSGGLGVMGEAGPEAIMPLKRGKNGKLGVQMEGGGGNVTVENHFHISANGDDSVKRIIAQEAPKIASYTQQQIMDQRRRGGAVKATFG